MENSEWIVGRNPVWETLQGEAPIQQILLQEELRTPLFSRILKATKDLGIPVKRVPKRKLDAISKGVKHQGIALQIASAGYVDLWNLVDQILERGEEPFLIVLDRLEDPRNLGAILRTADAAGAHGVVVEKRGGAGLTGAVAKVSAGAVAYVPVARVSNISDTLKRLKEHDIWIYGTAGDAPKQMRQMDLRGPIALVIGGEGRGLRPRVRSMCDELVSIPMCGHMESLNASVAAGLLLYEVAYQRGTFST